MKDVVARADARTAGAVKDEAPVPATPWRVVFDGGYAVLDAEDDLIAIGMATGAQARLIAAAPDLLEACKAAEEWLSGWASADPYIEIVRAALAKAQHPVEEPADRDHIAAPPSKDSQ